MDRENLDAIIARYLQKFDLTNEKPHEEYFKWQALACFQKHWNVDAEDMLGMFTAATRDFAVLLDGSRSTPTNGIKELLKKPEEVELVRSAFKTLLEDDHGDLQMRQNNIDSFIESINTRIEHYWPGSHLYPQTRRSAIGYLTLAKPSENYIYFYSKAENWANCVEFDEDIGSGSEFSLTAYYRMCDELVREIENYPALIECDRKRKEAAIADNKSQTVAAEDFAIDDHYHTLAYDIIYCATTYHLYVDIPHYFKGLSKRIERARERHERDVLQANLTDVQQRYDKIIAIAGLPANMVGLRVVHKTFGEGTILSHTDIRQEIEFADKIRPFLFPDAYVQKFLTPATEDGGRIIGATVEAHGQLSAITKELNDAKAAYEKKKAAFDKKWVKNAKAAAESDEDD